MRMPCKLVDVAWWGNAGCKEVVAFHADVELGLSAGRYLPGGRWPGRSTVLFAGWAVGSARRTSSLPVRPWYWTDLPLSLPERHACGTTHTCTGFRPEVGTREGAQGALQERWAQGARGETNYVATGGPFGRPLGTRLRLCSATQSSGGTRVLTTQARLGYTVIGWYLGIHYSGGIRVR